MKRILSIALSGALLITSIPLPVNASAASKDDIVFDASIIQDEMAIAVEKAKVISASGSRPGRITTSNPDDKALEDAIKAIKTKISVPKSYSEFDYNFYESNSVGEVNWNLTWRNPDNGGYINVRCDGNNNIISYRHYDATKERNGVPQYLKKELLDDAEQFITKIAPEVSGKLKYLGATFDGIYSGNYIYNYQRIENGVIFPDNTVNVSVSSVTGEVTSTNIEWLYDSKVPSSDTKITKDKAEKLISDNMDMNLVYRMNNYRIYDSTNTDNELKAYLVYEPTKNYISVDAKTGEVYFSRNEWVEKADYDSEESANSVSGSKDSADAGSGSIVLTEEEIAKLNELNQFISKEEAINIVTENEHLYIDKDLKAYSANLSKAYDYGIAKANQENQYVWNVSLNDPREIDYSQKNADTYRAYAQATVDAKTGKIISFYASLPNYYDSITGKWNKVDVPYDMEASKTILEKFLKSQVNDYFEKSKLVESSDNYIIFYKEEIPVYGGYSYQYQRVNEGIVFPYNGINGAVAGTNGKIYSFNYNWNDNIKFESPKGAISPAKAMEYYLDNEGYRLAYEVNKINIYDSNFSTSEKYYDYNDAYSVDYEIRLVYRPDVNPYYISPFTGKQLDYNGEVYKKVAPYTYLDVKDIEENREILLLSDINVGFEGDYFEADKSIRKKELLELIKQVGYSYSGDELNMNLKLTREDATQLLINNLGLGNVAKLSGIFTTGYADEKDISKDNLGSVALAKGIGLMEADEDNKFNPDQSITRKDAVQLIIKYMKVYKERIY